MLKISFLFILLLTNQNLHAANSLSYSGRLVQVSGAPVTGPVSLRAELVYTNATSTVLCSQNLTSVALTKGVFHLKLDLNCTPKTMTQVLSETPNGESVAIRIIDQTNSKTYPLQAIHSVPFSKVAEQLPQMGASAGQALAWDGSKWSPTSVGTGNGTVMTVNTGTGLTGGPISTTGTISVAAGGITSTELAANSVTAAKINAGEITSTHISATANIPYSKLSIGVGEIPQDRINGLSTSMSALIEDVIADAVTGKAPSQNAVYDALNLKADRSNVAQNITAASVTGLTAPIAGADATNKTYVDNSATTLDTRITNEVATLNTSIGNKYDKSGGVITGDVTINTQLLLKGSANFVTVKANSGTANYSLTLPTSAGTSGFVLQTDGAGVLSWVNPSSVTTGTGTVNSASITDGSIVDADINASANIAQSKIAGLTTDLSNKEPNITAGSATQYWRGNKTWSSLQADVQALILNNYVLGLNSAVTNTDSLASAIGKLQGQINATNTVVTSLTTTNVSEGTNLYFTEPRVLGTDLLGFDNTLTGQIAATDSVLQAFGRTQKQINDINTSISGNQWSAGSGNVYRTSGNVGIGTATPTEKLEVSGTSKISGISFKRYSWSPLVDTTDTFLFKTAPMANGNNAIIELKVIEGDNRITRTVNIEVRNAGGVNQVKVTPLIGSAGDLGLDLKYANANSNAGITEFYIYKSIPRMWTQSVIVSGSSISFDSTGLDPAALTTASLNTGLQVSSTGMVGIGTSNPTTKLQVVGGVIRSDLGTTGQSLIVSGTGSNLQVIHDGGINAAIYNSGGGIQFRSTDGVTNNVTILSSGNVGIGTAAPTQKLEVNGNVKATQFCLGADCKSAWPVGLTSGSVTTTEILDGTIATADIADGAVSLVKLGGTRDATKYLKGDNTWSTFATDAINSVLSTFTVGSGSKPAVTNTDTVVGAFGKVQKTLNDINADYVSKTANQTINGTLAINSVTGFITVPTPINPNDAANKAYVDGFGQWLENGANIYFNTGNVGIGTTTPTEALHILKNDGVANGEHWLFRAEKSAAEGGVVIGYEADGTDFVSAKIRSSSSADLVLGTTAFMNMFTMKNNGSANFRGNNIPRFNPSMGMQLGDQDWTDFIAQQSGTFAYSSADKGIKTTGDTWFIINSRVPIDPNGVYRVTARIKKIDGTGSVYVGADSLDSNFNSIKTDSENSYNYFAAQQVTVAPGSTYVASGTISGHNIVGGTGDDRFDPNAKFFNVIIITNYQGTGNSVVEAVEIHKIPTLEPWRIPTFENSWTNYGNSYGTAAYFKDNSGIVHIRGLIAGGTINTCAFTLPVGYRPAYRILRATQTHNNAIGRVDIQSNGCVTPVVGDAIWFSLDGINFRTD